MKKFVAILLAVLITVTVAPVGLAYTSEAYQAATRLNQLGLLGGTGTNPDGTPDYDLDANPTRAQGIVMLLALLGEREEATSKEWRGPFTDLPSWARKYVNYAYQKRYTGGVSATRFGTNNPLTPNQYLTFVLKAMGYSSSDDFTWTNPYPLSDRLGITGGKYNNNSRFTRGDMAIISSNALNAKMKDSDQTLYEALLADGKIKDPNASASKIKQLVQFVDSNGSTQSDGTILLQYSVPPSDIATGIVAFRHNKDENNLYLIYQIEYKSSTTLLHTLMRIDLAAETIFPYVFQRYTEDFSNADFSNDTINPATYTKNTKLTFQQEDGFTISNPDLMQDLLNATLAESVYFWGVALNEKMGLTLKDIGFTAYDDSSSTPSSTPTPAPANTPSPASTPTPGPQTTKARQLAQYITANGEPDENGDRAISSSQTLSNQTLYSEISYDRAEEKLYFGCYIKFDNGSQTTVLSRYDLAQDAFENLTLMGYEKGNLTFSMTATEIDPAAFTYDTHVNFQFRNNPSNVDLSTAQQAANLVFRSSLLMWTYQLGELNYDIADFGYKRFYDSIPGASNTPSSKETPAPSPAETPTPAAPAGRQLAACIEEMGYTGTSGSKETYTTALCESKTGARYDSNSTISYDKANGKLCFTSNHISSSSGTNYNYTVKAWFDLTKNAFDPGFQVSFVPIRSGSATPFTVTTTNLIPAAYRYDTSVNFTGSTEEASWDTTQRSANSALYMALQIWRYQVDSCGLDIADMGFTQFYNSIPTT